MKVIIEPSAIEDAAQRVIVTEGLTEYFLQICKTIEYDLSGFDTIYCSYTEDGFYSIVKALQKEKGLIESVTEDGYYRAVAKTISYKVEGRQFSSIVLRDIIWDVFLCRVFPNASGNEENLPYFTYITAHEFGHCKDHFLRPENHPIDYPSGIDYHALNRYYSSILIDDYYACYYSARALSDSTFDRMVNDLSNDKEQLRIEVREKIEKYHSQNTDLYTIAKATSGVAWVILIQFAKIIGLIHGGCRREINSIIWPDASEATKAVLLDMEKLLRLSLNTYPLIDLNDSLAELWYSLAISLGFKFEQDEGGSAVFFNDESAIHW